VSFDVLYPLPVMNLMYLTAEVCFTLHFWTELTLSKLPAFCST
jgi:hypothetical protein